MDLKNFIKKISPSSTNKNHKYSEYKIVDSDNLWDLFMCGTEVSSCQRVDAGGSYNKCLIAYVMDGKNRMIAIKDRDDKIVARAIFRLLYDENDKKPVLFLERIYSNVLDKNLTRAIQDMAVRRAKVLGLTLLSSDVTQKKYPNSVKSLGGIAPFEYVDSEGQGVCNGSRFEIRDAFIV